MFAMTRIYFSKTTELRFELIISHGVYIGFVVYQIALIKRNDATENISLNN